MYEYSYVFNTNGINKPALELDEDRQRSHIRTQSIPLIVRVIRSRAHQFVLRILESKLSNHPRASYIRKAICEWPGLIMAMMASSSTAGNPYENYNNTEIEQDLIDPDDRTFIFAPVS